MQAYSRTTYKPQLKRFKMVTKYTHNRSEGLRGNRGLPVTTRKMRQTDAHGRGYVFQD